MKFNVDGLAAFTRAGWAASPARSDPVERRKHRQRQYRELENLNRISPELGGDLYLINGNMTKLADAGMFASLPIKQKRRNAHEEILELGQERRRPHPVF